MSSVPLDSLSLHKGSNRLALLFAAVITVMGLWVNHRELPDGYLYAATICGLVWGTLHCLGFGARNWQRIVIVLLLLTIQRGYFALPHTVLSSAGYGREFLAALAFYSIAMLYVYLIVWAKEREERRTARQE